jgi:hypothetical protein
VREVLGAEPVHFSQRSASENESTGESAFPQLRMLQPASNVPALHNRRKASSPRWRPTSQSYVT